MLFDRERGGYSRRTKLPVTVFVRQDEIGLYVDLPFCPSDRDEILSILSRALNTPTFHPSYRRLPPGPIDAILSLHVRYKKCASVLVWGPLQGCYFERPRTLHLGSCPSADMLGRRIKQLGDTFMEDAQKKITSHSPPPRLPLLRGRPVFFY